jgi:hypothetical protein
MWEEKGVVRQSAEDEKGKKRWNSNDVEHAGLMRTEALTAFVSLPPPVPNISTLDHD